MWPINPDVGLWGNAMLLNGIICASLFCGAVLTTILAASWSYVTEEDNEVLVFMRINFLGLSYDDEERFLNGDGPAILFWVFLGIIASVGGPVTWATLGLAGVATVWMGILTAIRAYFRMHKELQRMKDV